MRWSYDTPGATINPKQKQIVFPKLVKTVLQSSGEDMSGILFNGVPEMVGPKPGEKKLGHIRYLTFGDG